MTNAELIAKIKAEIERRKSLLTQHSKLTYDLILETFIKEYDDLLSFLSTLESEKPVPNDLEEAAIEYSKKVSDGHNYRDLRVGFIAGYNLCKEQMMKEAVKGDFMLNPYPIICLDDCKNYDFKEGDKVRVIVLPQKD